MTVAGRDVSTMTEADRAQLRGRYIGYIPQEPLSNLAPSFTVSRQLTDPMRVHLDITAKEAKSERALFWSGSGSPIPTGCSVPTPHQLSGGMAQRVLIAGALACEPAS